MRSSSPARSPLAIRRSATGGKEPPSPTLREKLPPSRTFSADRRDRDYRHQDRIPQCRPAFLVQRTARFAVVSEPSQYLIELAGLLARSDRSAVDFRKALGRIGQACGETRPLHHT